MRRAREPGQAGTAGELVVALPERASDLRSSGLGGAAVLVQPAPGRWDDISQRARRAQEGRQ